MVPDSAPSPLCFGVHRWRGDFPSRRACGQVRAGVGPGSEPNPRGRDEKNDAQEGGTSWSEPVAAVKAPLKPLLESWRFELKTGCHPAAKISSCERPHL